MVSRETDPAFFRPPERRLSELSNEELQALFEMRSSKVKIDPKGFWDNNKIVYWEMMWPKLMELYEVMLEIQSRYPKSEIKEYWLEHHRLLPQLPPKKE
jgi:hypothetical protein